MISPSQRNILSEIQDLDREDLNAILEGIFYTLYPNGDTEAEWSSDTLENVAAIINDYIQVP